MLASICDVARRLCLTESSCDHLVMHSYRDLHGSCLHALAGIHHRAWGEERHYGRAHRLVLLCIRVSTVVVRNEGVARSDLPL